MNAAENLALGWVEAHTAHDWADMPPHVQALMIEAAEAFIRHTNRPVFVVQPAGIPDDELVRFLESR